MAENINCKNDINRNSTNLQFDANIDYLCLFSNKSNVWYGRFISRDFKHCIIIVRRRNGWSFLDPLDTGLLQKRLGNVSAANLVEVYSSIGYYIVYGKLIKKHVIKTGEKRSCVDACKAIIGIHAPFVITPKQLKNHLIKYENGTIYS